MIEEENGVPDVTSFSPVKLPDEVDYKKLNEAHEIDLQPDIDRERVKTDRYVPAEEQAYPTEQAHNDNAEAYLKKSENIKSRAQLRDLISSLRPDAEAFKKGVKDINDREGLDDKDKQKLIEDLKQTLEPDTDGEVTKSEFDIRTEKQDGDLKEGTDYKNNIELNIADAEKRLDEEDVVAEKIISLLETAEDMADVQNVVNKAKDKFSNGEIRKENLEQIIKIAKEKTSKKQDEVVGEFLQKLSTAENITSLGMRLEDARKQLGAKQIDGESFKKIEQAFDNERKKLQAENLKSLMTEINETRKVEDLKKIYNRAVKDANLGLIDFKTDLEVIIVNEILKQKTKIQDENAKHISDMIASSNYSDALLLLQEYIQLNASNDEISMFRNAGTLFDKLDQRMEEIKEREKYDLLKLETDLEAARMRAHE